MNKTVSMGLMLGLALAAAPASAQIEAEGIYWFATPDGTGSVGISGIAGTRFDVQDDLGFDEAEGMVGANLYLGDKHQLGLGYLVLDAQARNELSADIRYQDLIFRVSTDVVSTLEASLIRALYRMNLGEDSLQGGIILGAQYLDLDAEVQSDDVGRAFARIKTPMPVVGGHLRFDPTQWASLRASFSGVRRGIDRAFCEDAAQILTSRRYARRGPCRVLSMGPPQV